MILYRYRSQEGAVIPETFPVIKETPKGYWISTGGYPAKKKFVLNYGRKRWAYPTLEEALQSFIQRKEWQLVHLERQRKDADHALVNAKAGLIGLAHRRRVEVWPDTTPD